MRTNALVRLLVLFGTGLVSTEITQVPVAAQGTGDAGTTVAKLTTEPVLRISKLPDVAPATVPGRLPHPLDPALQIAYEGLQNMQSRIHDYTATLVRRERIDGRLRDEESMQIKIRNGREVAGQGRVPFSIYMRFTSPSAVAGREVIWVEGHNSNKLTAHEAGRLLGAFTVNLDPDGALAMRDNRYPIYEAGLENLVVKLIEKAERDRAAGDCQVEFFNAKVEGRDCTLIKVTHPERKRPYDFHVAKVYIDKELNIPIRYQAFTWPKRAGEEPVLEEEYTYTNVRLNVGLTDRDFDPSNPDYLFN